MKYTQNNKPLVCMQTQSTCYKGTRTMTVKGILWHDTGANNPYLKRYIQPSDDAPDRVDWLQKLGKNAYNNDWNHIYRKCGMNCWIGKLADGTVTTVQTMPWDYRPWGCGSGKKGSCNNGWIQFEICEDGKNDPEYLAKAYGEACEITAYLCRLFNIDPLGTADCNGVTVPTILCHYDSCKLGLGSNHGDIYDWFPKYGKNMETARADVAWLLAEGQDTDPPAEAQPTEPEAPAEKAKDGYKLEHQGRTNKKNQPVRDLMIDEDEAKIVREVFDLLTNRGYGTNRVAQYLNERGIKTKKGTSLWRGTSVRALIDNPIYIGIYHMNGAQSEPFDHLKIIDEDMFRRCQQTVKGRSTKNFGEESMVLRTDTRSLLTGIIYCGHCGCRLCYNHQHEERKLAGGGTSIYDYETYRCYRKISSKVTCNGQSAYKAKALNGAVEQQVKLFLSKIQSVPKERLVELASARNEETYKIAYKQAEKDFQNAQKQVTALEEEAVKALTGESQLDLSVVNSMLVKHRAKLETAQRAMEDARTRMEAEKENAAATKAQIDELLSWAECFEAADIGTKHLIVARLIERVDVSTGYKVHIKFRISLKQFLGQ